MSASRYKAVRECDFRRFGGTPSLTLLIRVEGVWKVDFNVRRNYWMNLKNRGYLAEDKAMPSQFATPRADEDIRINISPV